MNQNILDKIKILADAAKYDVSCSSSGSSRKNQAGGLGNAASMGICHSFAADGRCISLLKILLSNHCIYDCAYCINRRSNEIPRASFSARELADITIEFYRRNYIEGLFLSSGVLKSPDYTVERMLKVMEILRHEYRFNGYIHLKSIPGAAPELVHKLGLHADRLSINLEIPTEKNLKLLAPEKDHKSVYQPIKFIHEHILENIEDKKKYRKTPSFAPAGQSTQIIVGATDENDRTILDLSADLYKKPKLRRVFYSGFVPVNLTDNRLPKIKATPLIRENRLYQADWLMRFYEFEASEILGPKDNFLDMEMDPKLAWAIRHPEFFPIDVNRADYRDLLRIPGLGVLSAKKIWVARKQRRLELDDLKRLGVVLKRAVFFISFGAAINQPKNTIAELGPEKVKNLLTAKKGKRTDPRQLSFDFTDSAHDLLQI